MTRYKENDYTYDLRGKLYRFVNGRWVRVERVE